MRWRAAPRGRQVPAPALGRPAVGAPPARTWHLRSTRPSSTPATTVAQAPVPHASVRPAPRSHTTMRTCPRLSTSTNSGREEGRGEEGRRRGGGGGGDDMRAVSGDQQAGTQAGGRCCRTGTATWGAATAAAAPRLPPSASRQQHRLALPLLPSASPVLVLAGNTSFFSNRGPTRKMSISSTCHTEEHRLHSPLRKGPPPHTRSSPSPKGARYPHTRHIAPPPSAVLLRTTGAGARLGRRSSGRRFACPLPRLPAQHAQWPLLIEPPSRPLRGLPGLL